MCLVSASGLPCNNSSGQAEVVEALGVEEGLLPGNLLFATPYVQIQGGELMVPMVNVGHIEGILNPRTHLACLSVA